MIEQQSAFQVGDQVIHWVYGLGEIIELDEKVLSGKANHYYVVQMRDLTLWVPQNRTGSQSLRPPTPAEDFERLFDLLASPGDPLSTNSYARKGELAEILKDKTLESICRVVRDLVTYKRNGRSNENDNSTLTYARNFLLNEWSVALSVPFHQAERELADLLEPDLS